MPRGKTEFRKRMRPLRASDAEFLGISSGIKGQKAELAALGVRASWAAVGLGLLRALRVGRIDLKVLRGMGGEKDVIGADGRWIR